MSRLTPQPSRMETFFPRSQRFDRDLPYRTEPRSGWPSLVMTLQKHSPYHVRKYSRFVISGSEQAKNGLSLWCSSEWFNYCGSRNLDR